MSVRTEYAVGEFCWVDLMSLEMNSAAAFYGALFGWTYEQQDTDGPPYAMFQVGDQPVAGMGQMSEEMKAQGIPPMWNSYINVDDVDATAEKAAALGGSIMMPSMQVMDAGRMAIISDPSGAPVSLWQKGVHFGAGRVNEVGCVCWNELVTKHTEKARDFFAKLFGWSFQKNDQSSSEYWVISLNDQMAGGIMAMTEDFGDMPPCWGVYFTVNDIAAQTAKVTELGGNIVVPIFEAPPAGKMCVASDPQGAVFNLIEMSGESS